MNPADWYAMAERFGILAVVAVALAGAIVLFARWGTKKLDWFGENIAKPMVGRHIQFLDETSQTNQQVATAVGRICESLEHQGKKLDVIAEAVKVHHDFAVKAIEKLDKK